MIATHARRGRTSSTTSQRYVDGVNRVVVVGAPGCGKSTTARMIGAALGLPYTELDSLWWDPDWTEVGAEVFCERARPVVAQERWVVDGNYFSAGARDVIWPRADTIVWLDLPRHIAVPRVVRRSFRRALTREELWNGNREGWNILRPDSIIRFAWRAWPKYGERYRELMATGEFDNVGWVRLQTPADVSQWVGALTP